MSGFLDFLESSWIIFLILGIVIAAGIAGYYVDKNTDILNIEKKKRELKERSMDVELLKSQIEDKTLSLGGAMGIAPHADKETNKISTNDVNNNAVNGEEDLSVPLNLDLH